MHLNISADLRLISGKKFTLIGTPEGGEIKDPSRSLNCLPSLLLYNWLNST